MLVQWKLKLLLLLLLRKAKIFRVLRFSRHLICKNLFCSNLAVGLESVLLLVLVAVRLERKSKTIATTWVLLLLLLLQRLA